MKKLALICLVVLFINPMAQSTEQQNKVPVKTGYHLIKKVPLADEGRWDYITIDTAARRLYVGRRDRVSVINIDKYTVVGEIPDTSGIHRAVVVPELKRGFTSNGLANTVTIFDPITLKTIGVVAVGTNPDWLMYDRFSRRIITSNGKSMDLSVIDPVSAKVLGTIPLGGKPETAATDENGTMYVNLEDKNELAVFDPVKMTVTARWPLEPCEEPTGLAIDNKNHRLFVACGGNRIMAVVDAVRGKVITTQKIGEDADAIVFEPSTGNIFTSNSDKTLTVLHADSPDKVSVLETVATRSGARTVALDTKTHRLFLMSAEYGPAPAATPENPKPKPIIMPHSVQLLVLGK